MKVAIVGSGISGLVVAHHLARRPDVEFDLYEASDWIGGHTHTVPVEVGGRRFDVDTGFIVHNDRTYPHFVRLLETLGVEALDTEMSFGLSSERTGLEYSGASLSGLFAQRRNLLRPRHWKMLRDILRFFREAPEVLDDPTEKRSLAAYLSDSGYGDGFCEEHLLPMAAAIWSAQLANVRDFPVQTFVRFFQNHGLLSVDDRPQWRVVRGGSASYVEALIAPFRRRIRTKEPVASLERVQSESGETEAVLLRTRRGESTRYDRVVVATHSDQALAMLDRPTPAERAVLGAISYQPNEVVLHGDTSLMPQSRRAWAAWNYRVPSVPEALPIVTYDMNRLQGIEAPPHFFVTLNAGERIDPASVYGRYEYAHPVLDARAVDAQGGRTAISGSDRIHYAGAYWENGFHEDGVRSALAVVSELDR